jgi:hypothetical protein
MTEQSTPVTSREIESYIHSERAKARLKKNHIVFPSPMIIPEEFQDEEGDFKMPQDITALVPQQLGSLMSILNGLLAWYGSVLAMARIDRLTAERVKNFLEAKTLSGLSHKEFKAIEDRLAQRDINEMVIKAQDWFDGQDSLVIMMEQLYKDYERSFQLVSREITRRSNFQQFESREDNIDNARPPQNYKKAW